MKKLYALLVGLLICAAAGAAPATTLYLIGQPAGGWSPLKGTAMTQTSDGVFEIDITFPQNQWFGFSQKLGSNGNDWGTMNGSRYGAPSNDYRPTLDVPVSLSYPSENSFQLDKGEYHFTVDTNTNTFTVSGQEIEDPTANVLYLLGTINNWNATDAYKFAQDGNTYTLTVAALSGEFKIANSGYSQQFSASSPIELGVPTVVQNLGPANSTLAVGSAQNVTLTFVKESKTKGTLTITTESAWEAPAKAYFSANLSGDWEFNKEMTAKGEGVFALEGIEVTADKGYATFTTGELTNWTLTEGLRYGPAGEDAEVVSGDSYTATAGSDKAYVLSAGTWNAQITFTQEATTVVFTKTGGDVPGPEVTVPEALYFNGNLSGDAWAFNTPMTKTEASFSYDFEVANENGYVTFATAEITDWAVAAGGVRYVPTGSTDENVESGVASAMTVGSNGSWVLSKGKWHAVATFTAEGATVTFTLTGEPEVPEVTVPETLFFNGNLSGTEWVFNTPMTKADATFSYDFEVAGENGYVTFTTAEMTDWTVGEGGVRYVPAGNTDENVESGVASAMIAGNDGAWVLASGKWTAVATFTAEGASVTFTRTGDIVVPDDQPLNVTYNFTSLENMQKYAAIPAEDEWSDDGNTGNICYYLDDKALVSDGVAITAKKNPDVTGSVTGVRMYKTKADVYDFRANKNNFVTFTAPEGYYFEAMTFSFNTAAKMNVLDEAGTLSLATKKDGNYYPGSFTPAEGKQLQSVTFEPTATCRFATIDITLAKLPDDPEDEYPVLYLRGADNGWGADESNLMTCNKGIYTITLPSLYGAFKIAAADWADENTATTQNMEMALDVTYTVEHPQGGGSNMAMAEPLKDATIVYDSKNNTLQVTGTVDTECAVTYLLHGQFNLYQAPAEEGIVALEEAAWNDIELTENNGVYSTTVVPAAETGSFVVFQKRNGVDYYTLKAAGSEPLTASAGITLSPDSYTDATYSLDPTHKYILALDPTSLQMTATDGGTTGIDGIIVDNTGAEVRYFNLQGVSVANPTPGLYIVVRGGKATKEYIR